MMLWIVRSSQKYRRLVLAAAVALIAIGFIQLRQTSPETLPEFGPVRVDVQVEALGLSAEEVENLITQPLENALGGIAGLKTLRSKSVLGLSSIEMLNPRRGELGEHVDRHVPQLRDAEQHHRRAEGHDEEAEPDARRDDPAHHRPRSPRR